MKPTCNAQKPKLLRPRQPLRGQNLTKIALRELQDIASWQGNTSPTWGNLASRLGVSRQALERRYEVKTALAETKRTINRDVTSAKGIVRLDAEARINKLNDKIAELMAERDAWLQKWAEIERNLHMHQIDPAKVFG